MLGPSSHKNRHKNDIQVTLFFECVLDWILKPLGVDFGSVLGCNMDSKSVLKLRCEKPAKLASRLSESSIFKDPGGSKIDETTIKKLFKNGFKITSLF